MEDEGKEPELPQPEVSGSQLSQVPPEGPSQLPVVSTHPEGAVRPFELSDALERVPEVRGQAGMLLLHGHAVRLERETQQLRLERNEAVAEGNRYRDLYHDERRTSAVLRERLSGLVDSINLRSFIITVGSILLGVSVPLAIQNPAVVPIAGIVAGAGLLVAGWRRKVRREEP